MPQVIAIKPDYTAVVLLRLAARTKGTIQHGSGGQCRFAWPRRQMTM